MNSKLFKKLLFFSVTTMSYAQDWAVVGNPNFSSGEVHYTSIIIEDNVPFVSYQDVFAEGKATVKKFENGNWQNVGVEGFTEGEANWISLASNNNSEIYIGYMDGFVDNKLTVKKYENESWQTVGISGFSDGVATDISLAINSDNILYVAYRDIANSYKITVKKFENGNWQTVGNVGFSTGLAEYISLKFDSDDVPFVAYCDNGNGRKATVKKFQNNNWLTVGTAGLVSNAPQGLSLAINDYTPYIGYVDNTNKLTIKKFQNGLQTVGSTNVSGAGAEYISLQFNNNIPYVAYTDLINYSGKITVKKLQNNNWVTVGVSEFTNSGAKETSLTIQDNGNLFVAFKAVSKVTVMKYEESASVSDNYFNNIKLFPNPANGIASIENIPIGSEIKLVNTLGQVIYKTQTNENYLNINIDSFPAGLYNVHIKMNNRTSCKKLIIK